MSAAVPATPVMNVHPARRVLDILRAPQPATRTPHGPAGASAGGTGRGPSAVAAPSSVRMTRAGTPAATDRAGTSRVTTDPAPTTACPPIVTPFSTVTL